MHRLFVALPLPEAIIDPLLDTMEALPGARWIEGDNLHLTLRFIGAVDGRMLADVEAALAAVAVPPFPIALAGVGHFDKAGRVSALWARVQAGPELARLQQQVEWACRRAGLAPETRRFVPHVTLARIKGNTVGLEHWLARHGALRAGPWRVDGFTLFESHLGAAGAHYEAIAHFPCHQG